METLKVLSLCILSAIWLTGCKSGTASSSGGGDNPIPIKDNSTILLFDDMTDVPVVNGISTFGKIYIHNYSDFDVNGINYSLSTNPANTSSAKKADNRPKDSSDLIDSNGFTISNPSSCSTIKANSFCALDIMTPELDPGYANNALLVISYTDSKGNARSASKIINYRYYDASAFNAVNFTTGGSVTALSAQGSTRHVVGYIVGGGVGSYQNVRLIASESSMVAIANGFSDGSEVAGGQAIAVEFVTQLNSSVSTSATVTPYANGVATATSSPASLSFGKPIRNVLKSVDDIIGSSLIVNLVPNTAAPHLAFGNIPVIDMTKQTSTLIHVINDGNADANGFSIQASEESAVTIENNCNTLIESNTSCSISYQVNSSTPGSAIITYSLAGSVVGSDTINWVNESMIPVVNINVTPSEANIFTQESLIATFTASNIGSADLKNVSFNYQSGTLASIAAQSTDCASDPANAGKYIIPAHGVCHAVAKFTALTTVGSDLANMTIVGSSVINNYSFDSAELIYHVFNYPTLGITPGGVVNLVANAGDTSIATQVYTISNSGSTAVQVGPFTLQSVVASEHQPAIDSSSSGLTNPCLSVVSLLAQQSCELRVKYGPWSSITSSESGSMALVINYGDGSFSGSYQKSINYSLTNTSNEVTLTLAVDNLSGSGSQQSPYLGSGATIGNQSLMLTYINPTTAELPNFNVNTNGLPLGLVVGPASTCPTGANMATLAAAGSCVLILTINQEDLTRVYGPLNGGELITYPAVSWATGERVYKQAAVADQNSATGIYLQYKQATITPVLQPNSGSAELVDLSFTVTNAGNYASPFGINVSGVSGLLQDAPVGSGGCVVNNDFSVDCNLLGSKPQVSYLMPNYLSVGSSLTIPLQLNLASGVYAYLSSNYLVIHYTQAN